MNFEPMDSSVISEGVTPSQVDTTSASLLRLCLLFADVSDPFQTVRHSSISFATICFNVFQNH